MAPQRGGGISIRRKWYATLYAASVDRSQYSCINPINTHNDVQFKLISTLKIEFPTTDFYPTRAFTNITVNIIRDFGLLAFFSRSHLSTDFRMNRGTKKQTK